jgi:signal peptidase I
MGRISWAIPALSGVALATLLPLATFLVAAWLLGWQLQAVLSGSMSPTYPVGSMLVVGQIDASQVSPGMVVVFEDPVTPGRIVSHRVVKAVPGTAMQFITQGDANAAPDPAPVPGRMIRGRVLWAISGLGAVVEWLQWPRVFFVFVLLPAALLVAAEVAARRRPKSAALPDVAVPADAPG